MAMDHVRQMEQSYEPLFKQSAHVSGKSGQVHPGEEPYLGGHSADE